MNSDNVKYAALKALVARLDDLVPGIPIKAMYSEEEEVVYPSLAAVPQQFEFMPWCEQERFVDADDPAQNVVEIGTFEGQIELRLYAKNAPERETWSQAVLDAFCASELAPGVLTAEFVAGITVGGYASKYTPMASFMLANEEWRDELVFTNKRYAFLTVDAVFPVYALRTGEATITELDLVTNADAASEPASDETTVVTGTSP